MFLLRLIRICSTGVVLIPVFWQLMSAIISCIFYVSKLNFWKRGIGLALCSPVQRSVLVRCGPFWVILKSTHLHKECTDKKKSPSRSRSHPKWSGHSQQCLGYVMHPNYKLPSNIFYRGKQATTRWCFRKQYTSQADFKSVIYILLLKRKSFYI